MDKQVKVKICGIRRLEDALAAQKEGADYLGFILQKKSKRYIEPEAVRDIVQEVRKRPRGVMLVGVFVDENADKVAHILDYCGLDLAQLSGQEVPAIIGGRNSPLYGRVYKAIKPATLEEALVECEWFLPPENFPNQPSLLLDAYHPTLAGGTGQMVAWELAAEVAAAVPGLMLAGGLTPGNVAQTVVAVRPYAVDVSSGVESKPGIKDHALIRSFIASAKAVQS